jgi:stalled ribosome rescue protein Dom34
LRVKEVIDSPNTYVVTPEDESDILLILYLLDKFLDKVNFITEVDWQFKSVTSTSTKRLSRVRVKIKLKPEKYFLSEKVDALRVTGRIIEASIESGVLGKRLGIDIKMNNPVGMEIDKSALEIIAYAKPTDSMDFLAISVNNSFGTIALISDTLNILEDAYFGGGKFYLSSVDKPKAVTDFIKKGISIAEERKIPCIIGIPGSLYSYIKKRLRLKKDIMIIDVDAGGLEGLIQILGKERIKRQFKDNKMVKYRVMLDRLHRGIYNERVVYGDEYIDSQIIKINILMMSTRYVVKNIEKAVNYNFQMIRRGKTVSIVPLTNPLGYTVEKYGGIIGLL